MLTTLHVLLPSLLLPALDILDRGLVTRVILNTLHTGNSKTTASAVAKTVLQSPSHDGDGNVTSVPTARDEEVRPEEQAPIPPQEQNKVHIVRSAQEHTRSRIHTSSSSSTPGPRYSSTNTAGTSYVVHVEAWNCSCAAFAFAAFPAGSGMGSLASWSSLRVGDQYGDGVGGGGEEKWEFGGLSRNGLGLDESGGGGGVPCCKHLLACGLGERWGVIGEYVKERRVGREEFAGLVAGL